MSLYLAIWSIGSLVLPSNAHAQGVCTSTDQQSGEHCTSATATPWQWFSDWNLNPRMYPSLEQLTAAMISAQMSIAHPPRCSFTFDGLLQDIGGIGYAWPNSPQSDISHNHQGNFTSIWTSVTPCDVNEKREIGIYQHRTFTCPQGYGIRNQTGVGLYCAITWWVADPRKAAGACAKGQMEVGNPCEIGSGNKHLLQEDYRSNSSLAFQRHYNSNYAINYQPIAYDYEPLGPGWTATYFQRIDYVPSSVVVAANVYRPDGKMLVFQGSGATFTGPPDIDERLVAQRDQNDVITGWTLTTSSDDVETYDGTGRLVSIVSRGGYAQTLQYGQDGNLSVVVDNFGRTLEFIFDQGRLQRLIDPAGQHIDYVYNPNETLATVTFGDGTSKQYHYDGFFLIGITDELASRYSTYGYESGRAASTELAGGVNKYTIASSTFYREVVDPLGKLRTYGFDPTALHHLYRVRSASSVSTDRNSPKTVAYDVNANISLRRDHNNNETQLTYDLSRNLETSRTEAYSTPRARTIATQWHSTYRLPIEIDEPGKRTTFTHDANGNVLTKIVLDTTTSDSRTWTYTYNAFGQVLTADGPRSDVSDVTTYTYYTCTTGYQCGQVHTITNALGHITTYTTYNAHGQPLTITDPNGVVTTLTYDLRQRLTSRTVGSEQTTFEYWPTGLLKKATLPDGSHLSYTYDAAHRLTDISDAEGNTIHYTLDAMGNRTNEELRDPSSALTQTRTRVFNTLNQLWKQIGAAGGASVTTTFGYDNNGNQASMAAPLGRSTSQTYDELNRLTQVTDPNSGLTTYGYDALDQLISVTDPRGKVTSYSYNALGDLTRQVSPDTGTTINTYDTGGNLKTSTEARGKMATYTYDALNRVTSLTYADQTIGYSYDSGTNQNGRLTQITDNSGSTHWSYDPQGRVLSRQQTMGAITRTLGYSYDSAGRLQTLTLPSGNTIQYGYANGKVVSLTLNGSTPLLSNVLYQPFGPIAGWRWGNSTLAVRDYDQDGKLTLTDSAGLRTYSYDDAFRITGIGDASNPNLSQSYGYDLLDRLTSATGAGLSQGWTYDANGNRLSQTGSAPSAYTVSANNNRIASITGALAKTYTYDAAGNTTSDGATSFAYNDAGRMMSATKAGVTSTYALNGLGQRVRKTTGGHSIYFVYDEAGRLIGEYDGSGNLLQETVWFGDIPVAVLKPNSGAAPQTVTLASTSDTYIQSGTPTTNYAYAPQLLARLANSEGLTRASFLQFGLAGVPAGTITSARLRLYGRHEAPSGSGLPISVWPGTLTTSWSGVNVNYNNSATLTGVDFYATSSIATTTVGINAAYREWDVTSYVQQRRALGHATFGVAVNAAHLYRVSFNSADATGNRPQLVVTVAGSGGSSSGINHFYIHTDHLNTPRKITRPDDNAMVWRWDADPFGTTLANEDPDGDSTLFTYSLRFPGQYFGAETGLHYNYFRDYDPSTGRYVQSDPIGLYGGMNTYAYTNSQPMVLADPRGLQAIPIPAAPTVPPGTPATPDLSRVLAELLNKMGEALKSVCPPTLSEIGRCDKVLADCRKKCTDIFVDNPEKLPGVGTDRQGRLRRCIRECMEQQQCFDF
ncbi:MAG TPA: DNRLRE domain-containing protein [Povalibacter sp.]|nr:DNRLRE domain-containing protein [Povalibacter sp.]